LLGRYRDEVPAYASTYFGDYEDDGLNSPDAYAEFAIKCQQNGFSGFKIHGFGEPDRDIEICRSVRDTVGESMDLMLDPASDYETFADAFKVGKVLDDLDFYWYEDPMADTGQSMEMSKRLEKKLKTPLLGMEHVRTGPYGRADHIVNKALTFVRGCTHLDGGITSVMKTAHVAESLGVDVELEVGGPSHIHCMAGMRNSNYFERGLLHPEVSWMTDQGFNEDVENVNAQGKIKVPSKPGLGVTIDWDFINEHKTETIAIDEKSVSGTL